MSQLQYTRNEQTIYSAAVYCRLSKDDEQAGESVSNETQKLMLTDFCHERGFSIYEINADGYISTGQDITGYNMFVYCGNNVVNNYDPTGTQHVLNKMGLVGMGGSSGCTTVKNNIYIDIEELI